MCSYNTKQTYPETSALWKDCNEMALPLKKCKEVPLRLHQEQVNILCMYILFTSSGKHFTQLKYKMLEIFFLMPVNSKFVIQCTQISVDVEAYYHCQQHPQGSIDRASGFLLKAADHYEMSGFLLALQDGNQSQRLEQVVQLAQFTASLPEVFAFIY